MLQQLLDVICRRCRTCTEFWGLAKLLLSSSTPLISLSCKEVKEFLSFAHPFCFCAVIEADEVGNVKQRVNHCAAAALCRDRQENGCWKVLGCRAFVLQWGFSTKRAQNELAGKQKGFGSISYELSTGLHAEG